MFFLYPFGNIIPLLELPAFSSTGSFWLSLFPSINLHCFLAPQFPLVCLLTWSAVWTCLVLSAELSTLDFHKLELPTFRRLLDLHLPDWSSETCHCKWHNPQQTLFAVLVPLLAFWMLLHFLDLCEFGFGCYCLLSCHHSTSCVEKIQRPPLLLKLRVQFFTRCSWQIFVSRLYCSN